MFAPTCLHQWRGVECRPGTGKPTRADTSATSARMPAFSCTRIFILLLITSRASVVSSSPPLLSSNYLDSLALLTESYSDGVRTVATTFSATVVEVLRVLHPNLPIVVLLNGSSPAVTIDPGSHCALVDTDKRLYYLEEFVGTDTHELTVNMMNALWNGVVPTLSSSPPSPQFVLHLQVQKRAVLQSAPENRAQG